MKGPWWSQPMRIAALQYAGEKDPLAVPALWQEAGFNVEQLLHLIGDGYYGAFDDLRHGRLLETYVAECRLRGLRVILYMNTHKLPHDLGHDEWAVRAPDGSSKLLYGTFPAACLNTGYADWLMEKARKALAYDIDGVFSDGPIPQACWCDRCRSLFKDEVGYDMPASPTVEQAEDLERFRHETVLTFMRRLYETIKRRKPGVVCYQNLQLSSGHVRDFLPFNDFVGTEGGFMFTGPQCAGIYGNPAWRPRSQRRTRAASRP